MYIYSLFTSSLCEFLVFVCYTLALYYCWHSVYSLVLCVFVTWSSFLFPVSHFLFLRSSLFLVPCPLSLVFFIDLCLLVFSFEFVALPPRIYFILCIVWSSCLLLYWHSGPDPHFVSRRLLSCLLSLYRDIYLITCLLTCLFDYDFSLVQLSHYFHYIVLLGPHSLSLSLTTRNTTTVKIKNITWCEVWPLCNTNTKHSDVTTTTFNYSIINIGGKGLNRLQAIG